MTPVVSLDVLPADVPAQYAPAMVAACTEALAEEGSCALASTLPESTQPAAVALVLWQGEGFLQVTVRVGRGGGQWVARALTFSERDSISERWTTVGLTVATLVGETRALEKPESSAAPAAPALAPTAALPTQPAKVTVADQPAPGSPPAKPPPSWLAGVGVLVGPGWDGGGLQGGGWLAMTYRVPRLPFQVHAAASYAQSSGPRVLGHELKTHWMTAAFGAGVFGTWRALSLVGSAALELGYRRMDVDYNGRSASDQEVPLRLRTQLSFPADGTLAATLGSVVRIPPQNPNRSSGLSVQSAAIAVEGIVGLEVRL